MLYPVLGGSVPCIGRYYILYREVLFPVLGGTLSCIGRCCILFREVLYHVLGGTVSCIGRYCILYCFSNLAKIRLFVCLYSGLAPGTSAAAKLTRFFDKVE